jgi:hypothetical protein
MPSQNKFSLAAVLTAPAQTLEDGILLVFAESSSTFPKINCKIDATVIKKTAWDEQIKSKWGNQFDPGLFRNAKTHTSNRNYNYPDITWDKNIKEIKSTPHKYTNQYLKIVDKVFSEYGKCKYRFGLAFR